MPYGFWLLDYKNPWYAHSMKQLDPRSVWLFFFAFSARFFFMFLFIAIWAGVTLSALPANFPGEAMVIVGFGILGIMIVILLPIIACFVWSKLTYHFYRYELRKDNFYRESGVIWKHYVSIPYQKIQNVDIRRGIIARILGLSDIQIQTAGASMAVRNFGAGAEGRLPGLSMKDAEHMRDELIKRSSEK